MKHTQDEAQKQRLHTLSYVGFFWGLKLLQLEDRTGQHV